MGLLLNFLLILCRKDIRCFSCFLNFLLLLGFSVCFGSIIDCTFFIIWVGRGVDLLVGLSLLLLDLLNFSFALFVESLLCMEFALSVDHLVDLLLGKIFSFGLLLKFA